MSTVQNKLLQKCTNGIFLAATNLDMDNHKFVISSLQE